MMLGIIPARGGSKGIPNKNIKSIAGKPLIAWTIEAAQQSKLLDDFIVSTDSAEIAEISQQYGSKYTQRPKHLATDTSLIIDTLQDLVEKIPCDTIVLLQPTSPIRNDLLIDACISLYKSTKTDVVVTGFNCKYKPFGTTTKRRQDTKGFFYNDGNVMVINKDIIKQGKLFTDNFKTIYTSREENIEIDDDFDFWLAEKVLMNRNK